MESRGAALSAGFLGALQLKGCVTKPQRGDGPSKPGKCFGQQASWLAVQNNAFLYLEIPLGRGTQKVKTIFAVN